MKKLKSKKGFTLMELLIVVAIIGILVAIAIPTYTSSMNKAKIGVDEANVRAWYAESVIAYLTDGTAYPTTYTGTAVTATGASVAVDTTAPAVFEVTYSATGITDVVFGQ